MDSDSKQTEALTEHLVKASHIVAFTGAGISTGAGIPDYRGPEGVWKTRPEITLQDFFDDPALREKYWGFKAEDWAKARQCGPTPAHQALTALQQLGKLSAVITQNIDGLHRLSGIEDDRLIELHGRMDQVVCINCGFKGVADAWYQRFLDHGTEPICPDCEGLLKPGVIQFGENLRPSDLERAQEAMMQVDLVLAIGSTLAVQPAASFPLMAARMGIPYIIINRGETAHDGMPHVSLRIDGDVQELLPRAVEDAGNMFG